MLQVSGNPGAGPLPQLAGWEAVLQQVAAQPLAFCPDFPAVARRHEAFWQREVVDRPLFLASVNADPGRPITRRLELLDQPDAWFEAKMLDLAQTHRVGDTLPTVRVDFGATALCAFFGASVAFVSDTTWTHAFITDDWSNAPDWQIQPDNVYWRLLQTLTERVAAEAVGSYVVMLPDLGAPSDILLNLRGATALCLDVIDQPARITAAIAAIEAAWREALVTLNDLIIGAGAGLTYYLGLWSGRPHYLPASDFNAMLSPAQFEALVMPSIRRQIAAVGRAIFHLDGPAAARHADTLMAVPELDAIQYVVGTGQSALPRIDMLQRIQRSGKALQVLCAFDDVLPLAEDLVPEGLAFLVDEAPDVESLDRLYETFCRLYA